MKVINLGETNSILNNYIEQIRDKVIQKDRARFRSNLVRIGRVFGYELSKALGYEEKDVRTPLGIASMKVCKSSDLVIAAVLRAGIPLHKGLLDCFDNADSAFVAAYRKYDKGDSYHINVENATATKLEGRILILADTMLATGASIEVTLSKLCEDQTPSHIHLVCPISSTYAVEYLQKRYGDNVTLWTAAIDEELTSHSYIVPGLGDAGDLSYGEKF